MKRISILIFFIHWSVVVTAQRVNVTIERDAVYFLEGMDSILKYQIAEKSINGKYKRANYIHPLYNLDGQVITEDFPEDHLHHRGIFWAWHQLYVGEKQLGDGWDIENFSWEINSVIEVKQKRHAKAIETEVFWKSPLWLDGDGNEKPIVKERTIITVYPVKNNFRKIDIEISLLALEDEVRLGGSEDKKGYGGFSQRLKLGDDIVFRGQKGIIQPQTTPIEAEGWLDISERDRKYDKLSGFTILSHPGNPGFPNPWIVRNKRSMQNAVYPFPGANSVRLSHTQPTILRYRMLVYEKYAKICDIERMYRKYKKL